MKTNEVEAHLRGQLIALVQARRGETALAQLRDEARAACGGEREIALLIEYHLNRCAAANRVPEDALAIAATLRERAERALPEQHPTARAIRSHHVTCLSRQGHPGDLSRAVALRREEVDRAVAGGAGADWLGVTRMKLARALLDRGRYGWLDRGFQGDPWADLAEATELADGEVNRRAATLGPDHEFTWRARNVQCGVEVARVWSGDPARGEAALDLVDALLDHEWRHSGARTPHALAAQRWLAEVLAALGRDDAEAEARLGVELANGQVPEEGHALVVLATILTERGHPEAGRYAAAAVAARRKWYSPMGYQVAEAQRLASAISTRPVVLTMGVSSPGGPPQCSGRTVSFHYGRPVRGSGGPINPLSGSVAP